MSNGCIGDIVLVVEPREWQAFTSRLTEETVNRSDLMPGEKDALGSLRYSARLRWPLKRCRKNENIFLYIGDYPDLLTRPQVWR